MSWIVTIRKNNNQHNDLQHIWCNGRPYFSFTFQCRGHYWKGIKIIHQFHYFKRASTYNLLFYPITKCFCSFTVIKCLTTLQMFDNMANVWQHSCFLQFISLVFWFYLLEVWKYLWHNYLDDFLFNCLMYFEDSIPGSGRVTLIAELSKSTKSSSHSIIVSTTFQTHNKSCPLQATIRTIQSVC